MQTHRHVAMLALLSLACDPTSPCAEGRYDPGPPRACVLADGGRILLDDAGPVDAAMLDAGAPADTGTCIERIETCDGTDEDCDGSFDETFACARGGATECTTSCGTTGSGTCSATCSPPAAAECTPPAETCNGVDDDCDGVADDGVFEWDTIDLEANVGSRLVVRPLATGWLAVFSLNPVGLATRRIGPDLRPTGPVVMLDAEANGVFDVAVSSTAALIVYVVEGGSTPGIRSVSAPLGSLSPGTPRELAPGVEPNRLEIAWSVGLLVAYEAGAGLQAIYSPTGPTGSFSPRTITPTGTTVISNNWGLLASDAAIDRAYLGVAARVGTEDDAEILIQPILAGALDGSPYRLTDDTVEQRYPSFALRGDARILALWSEPLDVASPFGPQRGAAVGLGVGVGSWTILGRLRDDPRTVLGFSRAVPADGGWALLQAFGTIESPEVQVAQLGAGAEWLGMLPVTPPTGEVVVGAALAGSMTSWGVLLSTAPSSSPAGPLSALAPTCR